MAEDDPFGLQFRGDRTMVVRPQPGGRRPPSDAPRPTALPEGRALPAFEIPSTVSRNPLLAAAIPILSLAPHLRSPTPPADPDALRRQLTTELDRYQSAARAAGADPESAEQAAWALAALLDDAVLNTPWGAASAWGRTGLVASRWSQTDAGEYFFEALANMQREPGRYANVLEIFHRCLAMGFEGRYRVARDRTGDVDGVRRSVARTLAELVGPSEPTLSPHWAGVTVAARSPGTIVPPWVVWTAAAALLLALFTGFRYRVAGYSEQLVPLVAGLPPAATIATPAAAQAPLPALPAPRPVLEPGFLAEEQRLGLVIVQEGAQRVLIRLTAPDLFAPGSDQIAAARRGLIQRIGQELATRQGRILVTGYTDNVPLRRSPRFASNLELSEARAALIGGLLAGPLQGKDRLTILGKGEADPIGDNATPEGRARNRRVEIVLLKVAGN